MGGKRRIITLTLTLVFLLFVIPSTLALTWTNISNTTDWEAITTTNNGSVIYAGTIANGLWKSTDYGASWTQIQTINTLHLDTSADGQYVILEAPAFVSWLSNDSGVSFTQIFGSNSGQGVISDDGQYILMGYLGLPYVSTDYGATWTQATGLSSTNYYRVAISNTGQYMVAVARTTGIVAYSSDYGTTWTDKGTTSIMVDDVTISDDGQIIYTAGRALGGSIGYIRKSTDAGATFSTLKSGEDFVVVNCNSDCSKVFAGSRVGNNLYYTTNGGASWTTELNDGSFRDGEFSDDEQYYYVVRSGGTISQAQFIITPPTYTLFNGDTTDFSTGSDNVNQPVLEKTIYGKIVWDGSNLDFSANDFDSYVTMGNGWVSVDSANLGTDVNTSAQITFYGAYTFPVIYADGEVCSSCAFVSGLPSEQVFNVPHFTNYSISSGTNITSCGAISTPGQYYLTQDIMATADNCLDVTVAGVAIDGQGHTINSTYFATVRLASGAQTNFTLENTHLIAGTATIRYGSFSGGNVLVTNNTLDGMAMYGGSGTGGTIEYSFNTILDDGTHNAFQGVVTTSGLLIHDNTIDGHNLLIRNIGYYTGTNPYNNVFYNNDISMNYLTHSGNQGAWFYNNTISLATGFSDDGLGGNDVFIYNNTAGGNYWTNPTSTGYSDTCSSNSSDGICDTPYVPGYAGQYDYLPLTDNCDTAWSCSSYAACNTSDLQACTAVTDAHSCGIPFNGSLSTYDQSCDYCTPSWSCSSYTECNPYDKDCLSVADSNGCYALTGLPSDDYSGDLSEFTVECSRGEVAGSTSTNFGSVLGFVFLLSLILFVSQQYLPKEEENKRLVYMIQAVVVVVALVIIIALLVGLI